MSSLWMLLPLSRSHFKRRGVVALHSLCVVGLDMGRMEAFGRPKIPLENTEKKGLAQGTVAEITLTWQARIDMTCNRTTEFAGLALKTLECMGRSLEALGAIRSRRNANAMTTFAFVFNGMLMSHTRWIAPASKEHSKIQDKTAVASLWPHCLRSVSSNLVMI